MNSLSVPLVHPGSGHPINSRTRYLRERRENLRRKLGGVCARCPATLHLQFDVVRSVGKAHHEYSWRQRLIFYELMFAAGNLQLLCPACHVEKTLDDIARRRLEGLVVGQRMSDRGSLPVEANFFVAELFAVPISNHSHE